MVSLSQTRLVISDRALLSHACSDNIRQAIAFSAGSAPGERFSHNRVQTCLDRVKREKDRPFQLPTHLKCYLLRSLKRSHFDNICSASFRLYSEGG